MAGKGRETRDAMRSAAMLACAGVQVAEIARRLQVSEARVRKWRAHPVYQAAVQRQLAPTAAAIGTLLLTTAEAAASLQLSTVRHAETLLYNKEGSTLDADALDTVRHANEVASAALARLGSQGDTRPRVTVSIGQVNAELRAALVPGGVEVPGALVPVHRGGHPPQASPRPTPLATTQSLPYVPDPEVAIPGREWQADRRRLRTCAHGKKFHEACERCAPGSHQVPVLSGGPDAEILEVEGDDA